MHAPRDSLLWAKTVPSAPAPAPTGDEPDASDIICVLLEKLWLIVLLAVAGFFATYGYLARQAPEYQAIGSLQVVPPVQASPDRLVDAEPDLGSVEQLNTLVQELVRPSFLLLVANDPDLQGDLSLFPPKADGTPYTDQEKIRTLAACVRVALLKGTLLINVSATHTQPATAQRLCAAMLHDFVKERMENKSGTEEETYRFLLGEAGRLGGVLADEERQIQKYDQLAKYDSQIAAQKEAIEQLGQRYKDKYPAMIEARSLLQSLQDTFDAEMTRIVRTDEAAGVKPAVLLDPATPITDETRARMIGQYQVLKRDIETQRVLFASLTAQKNQSDVLRGAQTETAVKIGDEPVLPEIPVSQKPVEKLVGGTLAGAALGVALAFLLNAMDRSLKTVDEAEAFLGLPVLSAVPELARRRDRTPKKNGAAAVCGPGDLPLLSDGNSPAAEAIRSLRAALALLGAEKTQRSMIFTSALPGEGKSFTAANYALSLALRGQRTLLVDADLRRPRLHAIFGAERNSVGLVDYLTHRLPLDLFVHPTSLLQLGLLLSGTPAPSPAELLSGPGFARLMEEASKNYDRIVVDTAPVNAVGDTLLLIHSVQSVCLVVRAASSPREAVRRAIQVLDGAGARPVGTVFNRLPRRADLGYHRTYYYHYGVTDKYGECYATPTG
jgi:capsular exopolysaccharide synthesis family protein